MCCAVKSTPRWLLFVHQLGSTSSNLRVQTWRRLQQIGAIPVKQAVYVLPDSDAAREDFEWLKAEIEGARGEASIFVAESIDAWTDDALVEAFRRSREEAYMELSREIERALKLDGRKSRASARGAAAPARVLDRLQQRLAFIERIDFFGGAGRDRAAGLVQQLAARRTARPQPPPTRSDAREAGAQAFRRRLWVTRPRPGVDRMSSAWLIRRFIDPDARFDFVADREAAPADSVPFDMFGVAFTHEGDRCTFETLIRRFEVQSPAVTRLASIVHDLDLKDARFGAPEASTVGHLIDGLRAVHADDRVLLEEGIKLFESLYRSFEHADREAHPPPRAPRRGRGRLSSSKRKP